MQRTDSLTVEQHLVYDGGQQHAAGRLGDRGDGAPLCLQQLSELSLPLVQTLFQLLQTGFSPLQWLIWLIAGLQGEPPQRVSTPKFSHLYLPVK